MNRLHHKPTTPPTILSARSASGPKVSTEVGSLVRHAQFMPSRLNPHEILRLQRTIGNQATGQLMRQGNRPFHPLAISSRSPGGVGRKIFRTKWEAADEGGEKAVVEGLQWFRKPHEGSYAYKFEPIDAAAPHVQHQGEWRTRDQWSETPYAPPPDFESEAEGVAKLPPDEEGGWNVVAFGKLLQEQELPGICNGLSAAWLAGLIAPREGTTGINSANLEKVKHLKSFLDFVVSWLKLPSSYLTLAFIDYFSERGDSEWFDQFNADFAYDQARLFTSYVLKYWKPPEGSIKHKKIEGPNSTLTEERIRHMINGEVLSTFYNPHVPFNGSISVTAMNQTAGEADTIGHEWSFRYTPGGKLEIYDQNSGLTEKAVKDQAEISATLAEYIWKNYIDNPMQGRDSAEITLTVKK